MSSGVALLCPGPSLPRRWDDEMFAEYETVIAINSAGHRFKCHWLAAVDQHIMRPILEGKITPPLTGYITHTSWGKRIEDSIGGRVLRAKPYHEKCGLSAGLQKKLGNDRCGYTMPSALTVALSFDDNRRQVHVYGFDCAVGKPCVGNMTGDRNHPRFIKELLWLKMFWQPWIEVNSDIDPKILEWLSNGSPLTIDPPLHE